ncbi:MAG: phosphatase PAP2 family protein [Flammeovirgaceae bacterium]
MSAFSPQRVQFLSKQYLVYFIIFAPIIIFISKDEMTLMINRFVMSQESTTGSDFFFKYLTHLGDGLMLIPLFIILLFIRLYYALALAVTGAVHGIFIFIFKKLIFKGMLRPWGFFEDPSVLHAIEGVKQNRHNTFPSGHTATAFVFASLLSLIVADRRWSYLFLVLAALIGFSRVYLNQHFLIDTYFGAMVGIGSTFLVWALFEKWTNLSKKNWVNWNISNRKWG